MSLDDGKVRGKEQARLLVPNLPLCHWSSQLFNLRAPSSTDIPVLSLNQPIKIIFSDRNCFLTSFAIDGKDGHGLKLEKNQANFFKCLQKSTTKL